MTDQTTPEPLTDDVLDAMRGRSQGIDCAREAYDSAEDVPRLLDEVVPRLLDEVDRLRTELRNEREQLNRAFAENVRRLGEITGLRTKAKQAWSEGHSAALATGCDSEDQFRANLGALLVAEEQRCQLAINADPTDPHLNGRLAGLQRARDIVTGAAVPAELTEVETDSDPVVLDLRAQLDQARAESLTLGVSLAETIHERQQLRTRLADAEQTRRAALAVAADLTEDLAEARAHEPATATGAPDPDPSEGPAPTGLPGAAQGPAPLTLAQAAGHLHDWAGDLAGGARTDWPAGHPDIIRGIRAAADWLDARDRYEREVRERQRVAARAAVAAVIKARAAREAEPAEPTLRDVMAAAYRAGLGIRRDGDYIARDGNGEAWAYVEWSIVNGHGREVGRIGIEEGGSAYVWLGTRPGKPAQQYLVDPTPADILTAAREAGLIGDTDA